MSSTNHHHHHPQYHQNGSMSAPVAHPYAQHPRSAQHSEGQQTGTPVEDCRDFLRTGRCKYGASCKYNHPPNVQSGGGIKAPIDPSEPLYPLRPNEPICQYFIKHGTCKFGQACKFHHPPQMAGTGSSMLNNNAVLLSLPLGRKPDGTQGIWTTTPNGGGNDSGVQILPQRPDEPNCIYFLKNGRCKYGATCRYHHPLNFHDRSNGGRNGYDENGRPRHSMVQQGSGPKVHYVTSLPPGSMQQGHFVVADGTVTFLSLDGATPAHVVTIPQNGGNGSEGQLLYTTTPGTVTTSSSSTSIASSYETALSNLDGQDSTSSLWNRKPSLSNGVNGHHHLSDGRNHVQGNRSVIVQAMGDGATIGLPRVVSTGSASDGSTVFFDASGHPQAAAWRGSRSSSFDQTRSRGGSIHSQEEIQRSMSVQSALNESVKPRSQAAHGSRHQRQPGEVDEGLSQMTSALLTMLDTPEEAAAHQAGYDIDDEQQALTPRMGTRYSSTRPRNDKGPPPQSANEFIPHQQFIQYSQHHHQPPPTYFESHQTEGRNTENSTSWLPSWQDAITTGNVHENSHSMPSPQSSTSTHHTSSHVGLYLP